MPCYSMTFMQELFALNDVTIMSFDYRYVLAYMSAIKCVVVSGLQIKMREAIREFM